MLSLIVFIPLAGGILLLLLPRSSELIKGVALIASSVSLAISLLVLGSFEVGQGMQFIEAAPWIPTISITYKVGIDGLSLPLVILTGVLSVLSIIYSWRMEMRLKEYMFLFLLLQTSMLGVF